MKILMLADLYPPVIGGGERHVQSLSRELSKRGHDVTVFTIGYSGLPGYEEEGGVKIYRRAGFFSKIRPLFKDKKRRWHPPLPDPFITTHLKGVVEASAPDIIHAHGRIVYSALTLKKRSDTPLVVTLHSYALLCPKTNLMRGNDICDRPFTRDCIVCSKDSYGWPKSLFAYYGTRLGKDKLRLVDKFIAVSSFVKEVHTRHLGRGDRDIVVLPNYYEPDDMAGEDDAAPGLPDDFILFVGTLMPYKGLDLLIKAFPKVPTKTKLVVIGSKHLDYHYQDTDAIRIIRDAPHGTVMAAMSRCRFVITPSVWPEPLAYVVIEAMSQRKAVIASHVGGLPEAVIDGETGILVAPNNAASLSRAITYLLERPAVAARMGQAGYQVFQEKYTPDIVIPEITKIYQSLIAEPVDYGASIPE